MENLEYQTHRQTDRHRISLISRDPIGSNKGFSLKTVIIVGDNMTLLLSVNKQLRARILFKLVLRKGSLKTHIRCFGTN